MKKLVPIILVLIVFGVKGFSQINYKGKFETGYLKFINTTVQVDPGPNWDGYNLNNEQNGIDINLINGIKLTEKFYGGLGLGYVNFENINGFSIFTDFEFLPLKTKLTPLLNLKIGYNHIWNQYDNGTGSALVELGAGINYKLTDKLGIYMKSGVLLTQQSFLIPILFFKLGKSFKRNNKPTKITTKQTIIYLIISLLILTLMILTLPLFNCLT